MTNKLAVFYIRAQFVALLLTGVGLCIHYGYYEAIRRVLWGG